TFRASTARRSVRSRDSGRSTALSFTFKRGLSFVRYEFNNSLVPFAMTSVAGSSSAIVDLSDVSAAMTPTMRALRGFDPRRDHASSQSSCDSARWLRLLHPRPEQARL